MMTCYVVVDDDRSYKSLCFHTYIFLLCTELEKMLCLIDASFRGRPWLRL